MILLVITILLSLFFFVVIFLSVKTWGVTQIIFSLLVFAAAIGFFIMASLSLKTRTKWMSEYAKLEKQLEAEEELTDRLAHGDPEEVVQSEPSVRSVREALYRELLDRGRVWRNCEPVGAMDNSVTVKIAPAAIAPAGDMQPNGAEAEAPQGGAQPKGIDEKMLLYAFQEQETEDGWKVPSAYLGEFQVTQSTDTQVTLTPTLPLDQQQLALINQGGGTWALYEMMPADNHEPFAGLDEQELKQLMPKPPNVPDPQYEETIQQYVRTGEKAAENDPPQNVWVRVQFVKPHTVDVDSADVQGGLGSAFYDSSGRAVSARLRRGTPEEPKPAEFEVDDIAIFDQETAEQLASAGIVEPLELVYRRELNDYERAFHAIHQRMVSISNDLQKLQRDRVTMEDAKAKADEQIAFRQEEKNKLEQDVAKMVQERDAITEYAQQLQQKWTDTRRQLSELYRGNVALAAELAARQKELAEEIDRRTAVTAAP